MPNFLAIIGTFGAGFGTASGKKQIGAGAFGSSDYKT